MKQKLKRWGGCRQRSAEEERELSSSSGLFASQYRAEESLPPGQEAAGGWVWFGAALPRVTLHSFLIDTKGILKEVPKVCGWGRGQVAEQNISLGCNLVRSDISRQKFCRGLWRAWARSSCWAFNGQVMVLGSTWGRDDNESLQMPVF